MDIDRSVIERLLGTPGAGLDSETLRAVEEWHRAWAREWERVAAYPLRADDLPASLWCWPP